MRRRSSASLSEDSSAGNMRRQLRGLRDLKWRKLPVAEADGELLSERLAQAGLAGARRPAVVSKAITGGISTGLWVSVRIRVTAMMRTRADTHPWSRPDASSARTEVLEPQAITQECWCWQNRMRRAPVQQRDAVDADDGGRDAAVGEQQRAGGVAQQPVLDAAVEQELFPQLHRQPDRPAAFDGRQRQGRKRQSSLDAFGA